MGPLGAKNLADELARAVGNQVLFSEFAGGVNQRHQLDDARDAVEVAYSGVQRAQQINRHRAGSSLTLAGVHGSAQLADPNLAIFFGDVTAQKDQPAGLHKGHIGGGRRGHGGQADVQRA